jgi:hypothetical protein
MTEFEYEVSVHKDDGNTILLFDKFTVEIEDDQHKPEVLEHKAESEAVAQIVSKYGQKLKLEDWVSIEFRKVLPPPSATTSIPSNEFLLLPIMSSDGQTNE